MLKYLGEACRAARETAGVSQMAVVSALPPSKRGEGPRYPSLISRFETGQGWPQNPDEVVAAYAKITGTDELSIWESAVSRAAGELGKRAGVRAARAARLASDVTEVRPQTQRQASQRKRSKRR